MKFSVSMKGTNEYGSKQFNSLKEWTQQAGITQYIIYKSLLSVG
jgi:hypothetical protein